MKLPILFLLLSSTSLLLAQNLQEVYTEAVQAYEAEDYAGFLDKMMVADSLRTNHPTILYNLAAGFSLNHRAEEAISCLKRAVWQNVDNGFETDEDFNNLHEATSYQELVEFAEAYRTEVRNSLAALELEDASLHPEGIAYDPSSGDYFIGSVRHAKIIRCHPDGRQTVFNDHPGLWSVMGLVVDEQRSLLWATMVAAPQMEGYTDSLANQSAIVGFSLTTGEIEHRHDLQAPGAWLGDLVLADNGLIYSTSSSAEHPAIYRLDPWIGELEELVHLEELISLQGLCLDERQENLYFSDYRYGLFQLHLADLQLETIDNHTAHPLKGIDGLYRYDDQLIAVHNGLRPFQLVSYSLSEDGSEIDDFTYLDKALPEMGEPTLGVLVGDKFYYVANSPWGAYDRAGVFMEEQANSPIILGIELGELLKD